MPIEHMPRRLVPRGMVPEDSLPHRVRDGESWETLAATYRIPADQIIYANFETRVPAEVNWYLRNYVGCKKVTPDGKNWTFSTNARPGIIQIPQHPSSMNDHTERMSPRYYGVTVDPSKWVPTASTAGGRISARAVVARVRWDRTSLTIGGVAIQGRRSWTSWNPDWELGLVYYNTSYPLTKTLYRIVVHHTANDYGPYLNEWAEWQRNFAALGYHFFIDKTGTIYEGRPIEVMGAHAGNSAEKISFEDPFEGALYDPDWGSVGIVLQGNYEATAGVPPQQLQSLEDLVIAVQRTYKIERLVMHKEVKPTVCPGKHLVPHVEALRKKLGMPGQIPSQLP